MNGVIVLSLKSGMLLFEKEYMPSFGISGEAGSNALQLSSMCFALYQMSMSEFQSSTHSKWSGKNGLGDTGVKYMKQGGTLFTFTPYASRSGEIAQMEGDLDCQHLLVMLLSASFTTDAALILGSTVAKSISNSVLHKADVALPLKQSHMNKMNDKLSIAYLKGLSLLYTRKMCSEEFGDYDLLWLYRTVGRTTALNRKIEKNGRLLSGQWIRKEMGITYNQGILESSRDEIRNSEVVSVSTKKKAQVAPPVVKQPTTTANRIGAVEVVRERHIAADSSDLATPMCCCVPWRSYNNKKSLARVSSAERMEVPGNTVQPVEAKEEEEQSLSQTAEKALIMFSVIKLELLSARHSPGSKNALELLKGTSEHSLLRYIEQQRQQSHIADVDGATLTALRKIGLRQEFQLLVTDETWLEVIRQRSLAVSATAVAQDHELISSSSKSCSSTASSPCSRKHTQATAASSPKSWKNQKRAGGLQVSRIDATYMGGWSQFGIAQSKMDWSSVEASKLYNGMLHVLSCNDVVLVYAPATSSAAGQAHFRSLVSSPIASDSRGSVEQHSLGSKSVGHWKYLNDLTLWSKVCYDHIRPLINKSRMQNASGLDLGWIEEFAQT